MTLITIDGVHTQIGRAISLYGAYLLSNKLDSYSFVGISRPDDGEHKYDLTLPLDKPSVVPYQDKSIVPNKESKITITYIKSSSEPITFDSGTTTYYYNVQLESESKETLISFMEDARLHVRDVMFGLSKKEKKISCYIYDKMWMMVSKRVKRPIDTIYLKKKMLQNIVNDVETFLDPKTSELYHSLGRPYKRNYMLEGTAGTGKTTLIFAIASKFNFSVSILNFNNQIDDNVFIKAFQRLPDKSILVLEDIDCLFEERKKNEDHRNMITFSGLLNILDGLMHKDGLLTFMTTNYKNRLDPALIRPGRVDRLYHFGIMDKNQIKKMYNKYFEKQEESIRESNFTQFYKKICDHNLKLTPAILQEYFFNILILDDSSKTVVTEFDLLSKILLDHVKDNTSERLVI